MTFEKREMIGFRLLFAFMSLFVTGVFGIFICALFDFAPGRLMLVPFMAGILCGFAAVILTSPSGILFKD